MDKTFLLNVLEHNIHNLRNEGNILLIEDMNAGTTAYQDTLLNNNSHPNSFWLDEEFDLCSGFKINNRELIGT